MDVIKDKLAQITPAAVSAQGNIVLFSACAGVLAHQYFKRFEPDSISYAEFMATAWAALAFFFHRYLGSVGVAALLAAEVLTVFNTALLVAIVIYRLSPWHPLAAYPGPWKAKVSKLYWWHQAKIGQTGYTQAALHRQYDSDFVRIGPNWVSVRSADAIPTIYGGSRVSAKAGRGPWAKNDWYEGAIRGATRISLHQEVNVDKHAIRRKLWDHGFSGKALADYKPEILEFCDKLVRNVSAVAGRGGGATIDMNLQSSYFSFDVMGVLGFGEPFGMLDAGEKHFFVETLENAMQTLIPFHEISWIRILLRRAMPLPARLKKFESQNIARFEKRLAQGTTRRDIFTYLLGEEKDDAAQTFKLTRRELIADTGLIVVAGSDTTSSMLTWFWYYNTANPAEYAKLRAELATLDPDMLTDTATLGKLPYLNAALNETMRMQPAVPGGLRRLPPRAASRLRHDSRWWGADCDTYRPERWLEPGHNKNAYLPFSYGTRSCPGKGLAMVEGRLAVAQLASRFEFSFPPGFDQKAFEDGVRDHFTIQNRPLPLIPRPAPL